MKTKIINTTPHSITMQGADGSVFEVPPCGVLINARLAPEAERMVKFKPMCGYESKTCPKLHGRCSQCKKAVLLVETKFEADPASEKALTKLEKEHPGAVIVGSIIAAQAFPGRVFAMIPVKGFERVPPAEKRMRVDKFTTF